MELFTLLITTDKNCKKCRTDADCIIIGREDELIGFYCYKCGREYRWVLEQKYAFQAEKERDANRNKMQKLRKNVPKEKKRQSILQLAVQISLLDSEEKGKLDFLLDRIKKESISSEEVKV